jgi:hypothetical protein
MTTAIASGRTQADRNLRRIDCLAKVSVARRAAKRRRHEFASALDVFVRRAERAPRQPLHATNDVAILLSFLDDDPDA